MTGLGILIVVILVFIIIVQYRLFKTFQSNMSYKYFLPQFIIFSSPTKICLANQLFGSTVLTHGA